MERFHATVTRAAHPVGNAPPPHLSMLPARVVAQPSQQQECKVESDGVPHRPLLASKSHASLRRQAPETQDKTLRGRRRSLSQSLRRLFSSKTKPSEAPPVPYVYYDPNFATTSAGSTSSYTSSSSSSSSPSTWSTSYFVTPSTSQLSVAWSPARSIASSSSSLVFPLHPDYELELEIALKMAPHQLGTAWSHDSYNAMQYLRARTPYPPTMTQTTFDYHAQKDGEANADDRWQSALELGCGPGQMSVHLATRFAKVYGQDPSPNMLKLANTLKHMSPEELAEVRLPPVQDPTRIEYLQAKGEDPVLPPGEKVDLIMMAACIHWMDWETAESSRANWTKWASLLKPGGSLVVMGGRPVIGPYLGERGNQIRPLRDWLLDFPRGYNEIERYYGSSRMAEELRTGGLYRKLPMPWQHGEELESLWDRTSYCWIPIDDCTVLGDAATSADLAKIDDPEQFARTFNNLPDWIRESVRRAARCDDSGGDLVVSMTTPRKMADWVRSTSGYLKFLQDEPEQRKLSLQDDDFAAVELRKVCDQIGIGFDEEIECHHSGAVLCIRRSEKEI